MKLLILALIGLTTSLVLSKTNYIVKEDKPIETKHRLRADDAVNENRKCIFENGNDYWCFEFSQNLEFGQVWEQTYTVFTSSTTKYWKLRYNLYGKAAASILPEFVLSKSYSNKMTIGVDEFTTRLFGEMIWTDDHYLCMNAGWNSEKLAFAVTTQMTFKDCYKKLLNTFTDVENWKGPQNITDVCADSNEEEISIFKYSPTPLESKWESYYFGDGTKTKCSPGKIPSILAPFVDNIINSLTTKEEKVIKDIDEEEVGEDVGESIDAGKLL